MVPMHLPSIIPHVSTQWLKYTIELYNINFQQRGWRVGGKIVKDIPQIQLLPPVCLAVHIR